MGACPEGLVGDSSQHGEVRAVDNPVDRCLLTRITAVLVRSTRLETERWILENKVKGGLRKEGQEVAKLTRNQGE